MSRGLEGDLRPLESFPRVSGDEPREVIHIFSPEAFSPRERG